MNAREFGPAKVENEVLSLLLLQKMCPKIPVPRVLAYSEEGRTLHKCDAGGTAASSENLGTGFPGWVLMTRLPGRPLDACDRSPEDLSLLSRQLADIVASWRKDIPCAQGSANIHYQPFEAEKLELGDGDDGCPPATSFLDFWKMQINWKIKDIRQSSVFSDGTEEIVVSVSDILENVLPRLLSKTPIEHDRFVFTHGDLFPRNILVSEKKPPRITGIIGFEFSGFYPPWKEYVQEWQPYKRLADWPAEVYQQFLINVEASGDSTLHSTSQHDRAVIHELYRLRNYLDSGWLVDEYGEEAAAARAKSEIENAVKALRQLANMSP
ncbi:protein kinase-like protein [Fusarium austroafricanum]|uniref:Protein kinase-like protein n=1 Tax=Fusarium austroafricanum TaxID=2364996 RepID=A0A8H4NQ71_9HYPO|nr:protein kinase-like protein [Fusarium austroafricanum]